MHFLADAVPALVVLVALTATLVTLTQSIRDPEWFLRLGARWLALFYSQSERERMATKSPRASYYYFGTTGDPARDARIRRSTRIYSRSLGFLFIASVVVLIFVALVRGVLS